MADQLREDLINKLRKLRSLASSTNENEAAVAAGKLQELLTRYRLSAIDIAGDLPQKDDFIKVDGLEIKSGVWRWQLLMALCDANGARLVHCPPRPHDRRARGHGSYHLGDLWLPLQRDRKPCHALVEEPGSGEGVL